jgi:hypothetical protein
MQCQRIGDKQVAAPVSEGCDVKELLSKEDTRAKIASLHLAAVYNANPNHI